MIHSKNDSYRQFFNIHIASITLLAHHEIMICFNKNDHKPGEDHDEQYCVLGIHQKGDCAAETCILELWV